jgi:hypothetical protein
MTPKPLTGRVTKYDISNIFINGDLYFLPQEIRQSTRDKFPIGTIVTATIEKGSVKTIDTAKGATRDKFLKEEEAQRNTQSGSVPPTPLEEKLVKAGFNKAPVKEKAKKEKETRPAIMEIDKSGKETHPDISEVETSPVCESQLGAISKVDELIGNAITRSDNASKGHVSVCPIMSRSVVIKEYTIDPTIIQFAEVSCLLDDCEARYCRQLKAPVRIARKKCGKKDKPSCAECEAAYCRLIEGRC